MQYTGKWIMNPWYELLLLLLSFVLAYIVHRVTGDIVPPEQGDPLFNQAVRYWRGLII